MRRDRTAGLGRTQKRVLQLLALAERPKSVRTLAHDWPGLTDGSVYSALDSLGRRGLVDLAGWDGDNCRTFRLTERGVMAERRISDLEPLDEDDV